MERTMHTIETPEGKHKVELYDWVTGGDKRAIAGAKSDAERLEIVVERTVKSIDGKTEGILAILDSMHGKDYDFVFTEIAAVLIGSSLSTEKKSS